jgi:hypothetical protein
MKINTSKHTVLRELTAKIIYAKGGGVNKCRQPRVGQFLNFIIT